MRSPRVIPAPKILVYKPTYNFNICKPVYIIVAVVVTRRQLITPVFKTKFSSTDVPDAKLSCLLCFFTIIPECKPDCSLGDPVLFDDWISLELLVLFRN